MLYLNGSVQLAGQTFLANSCPSHPRAPTVSKVDRWPGGTVTTPVCAECGNTVGGIISMQFLTVAEFVQLPECFK